MFNKSLHLSCPAILVSTLLVAASLSLSYKKVAATGPGHGPRNPSTTVDNGLQWNVRHQWDTANFYIYPAKRTILEIPCPSTDRQQVHPSVCYAPWPQGWGSEGKHFFLATTTYRIKTNENPCVCWAENPTGPWETPPGVPLPLFTPDSDYYDIDSNLITAKFNGYFSDVNLTWTHHDSLLLIWRGTVDGQYGRRLGGNYPDTDFLFASISGDFIHWSRPLVINKSPSYWNWDGSNPQTGMGFVFISPSVWPTGNNGYRMLTFETRSYLKLENGAHPDSAWIDVADMVQPVNKAMLWQTSDWRQGFDTIGISDMSPPDSTLEDIWHGEVRSWGEALIAMVKLTNLRGTGDSPLSGPFRKPRDIMFAISYDQGTSWTAMARSPMTPLITTPYDTTWGRLFGTLAWDQYKPSFFFINDGNHTRMGFIGGYMEGSSTLFNKQRGLYYVESDWGKIPDKEGFKH